jgi:hypothetical protein
LHSQEECARRVCNLLLHVQLQVQAAEQPAMWLSLRAEIEIRARVGSAVVIRRVALSVMPVLTALVLVAGCGGGGSQTECGLDGCTITFPRSGDVAVSVLGVEARLVGVQNGTAELEVAGQRITVPVGGETQASGFTVGVEQVTDTEVVVRVRA